MLSIAVTSRFGTAGRRRVDDAIVDA